MNEAFRNEEMARRILQNQRAILEQNAKILANQEANTCKVAQENFPKKQRDVVPAIVKVSLDEQQGQIANFKSSYQLYCNVVLF